MKISEVSPTTLAKEKAFIDDIRQLLGTSKFKTPEFSWKKVILSNENVLGVCTWQPGTDFVTIDLKKSMFGDKNTVQRAIAHELCHEAEYLLDVMPKFNKLIEKVKNEYGDRPPEEFALKLRENLHRFMAGVYNLDHSPKWMNYANKVNVAYGKNFVTPKSDESYSLTSKQ